MKNSFILFLILISSGAFAQGIHVKGRNFEGYFFPKESQILINVPNEKCRYTPDSSDIFKTEKYIRDSIKYIIRMIKKQPDMRGRCVTKTILKKYCRQYFGFLNTNNERILWINFVRYTKDELPRFSKEDVWVLDGGSDQWSLIINIDTGEVLEMKIDGSGVG